MDGFPGGHLGCLRASAPPEESLLKARVEFYTYPGNVGTETVVRVRHVRADFPGTALATQQ